MSAQEPRTWQELLGQLIANPQERARLAATIRVKPITLQRWAVGDSRPRIDNIRLLIKNLPKESNPVFMSLLVADFPEALREDASEESVYQGIPAEFYARAMRNLALTSRAIYHQSMQDLILQQIIQHLDPDQQGISVSLAVCVPPRCGRKVRSLREVGGQATPPWPGNLTRRPMFLGSESLVGYTTTHAHSSVINSRDEQSLLAVQWTEYEESAAAFPILLHARIAGCLIVSSAHKHFFTKPRLAAIEDYAHLTACIFEQEETFDLKDIELGIMPPYAAQHPYFADYNRRVSQKLVEANTRGESLTVQQARQLVWQDIEEILLRVQRE